MRLSSLVVAAAFAALIPSPACAASGPGSAPQYDPSDCSASDGTPYKREHGTYLEYAAGRLQRQSIFELAAIHDSLLVKQPATIVIHLHGGLVDRCDAYGDIDVLGPKYADAGHAFPIFVIYHTGKAESYFGGVWHGTGAYPVEDPRAAALIRRYVRIANDTRDRHDRGREHADSHTTSLEEGYRYAPFINGGLFMGGRMWSYMKWTVDQSMHIDSAEADPDVPPPAPVASYVENEPGGLAFARMLHGYIDALRGGGMKPPRIMFVGHSTGAIYITKFIRAWHRDYPGDATRFEVVFEAPAVRYDDFEQLYGPVVAAPSGAPLRPIDRIARFRTFTMRDKFESLAPELGSFFAEHIYGPSLLYAISGIFEDFADTPLLGMQRFQCLTSNFKNYGVRPRERQMIDGVNDLLKARFAYPFAYSPAVGPSVPPTFQTQSINHGGYPHEKETVASINRLLADGNAWDADLANTLALDHAEQCNLDDPSIVIPPATPAPGVSSGTTAPR